MRCTHASTAGLVILGALLAGVAPAAGQSACASNQVALAKSVTRAKVPPLPPGQKELFDSTVAALRRGDQPTAATHFQALAQARFTRTSGPAVCRFVAAAMYTALLERDPRVRAELEALVKAGDGIDSDAQLANKDLQSALQKQQQTLQQMSAISKLLEDTAMAVIRKMGG